MIHLIFGDIEPIIFTSVYFEKKAVRLRLCFVQTTDEFTQKSFLVITTIIGDPRKIYNAQLGAHLQLNHPVDLTYFKLRRTSTPIP